MTIGDDDEKMSKSLGNFVTVHDLIQQVDPQTLRFFMATTQYRRPIRYSESTLSEAANNLQKLRIAYDNLSYRQKDVSAGIDTEVEQQLTKLTKAFTTAMDDDFNVQNGMTEIYELAKLMNIYSEQKIVREATLNHLMDSFTTWLQIFGVDFKPAGLLDDEIEQLIQERIDARTNKDYQRSDEIRDLLKAQGIVLEDTAQGTRWRRE